jgi:hypothetical protein
MINQKQFNENSLVEIANEVLHLWRNDGERFSRNDDGTYTGDNNKLNMPTCFYKYSFRELMNTGKFSVQRPDYSVVKK